jgi:energy-coupling factor transporter ATP-binding protein EcfA2
MAMFDNLRETLGITIVIVSHDPNIAKGVDRVIAIRDGKTSSEILRADMIADIGSLASLGDETLELAVVDRAGRVQIPAELLKKLSIEKRNKVRVEAEDGRIVIYPVDV